MRRILLLAPLLTACSQEPSAEALKPGSYFGQGRDALCIVGDSAPQRFAFVAFAKEGDTNCGAEGRVERTGAKWQLVPAGEGGCRIPLTTADGGLTIGRPPAACAYYCGPGARLGGQSFKWRDTSDELLVENPFGHGGVC